MHIIKHIPEDFVVDEVSTVEPKGEGKFVYCRLRKRDCTTNYALRRIAQSLKIPAGSIGYAGNKDRRAVTSQVISLKNISRAKIESLRFDEFSLKVLGFGDEPVFLGALKGNRFKITVRNIVSLPVVNPKFKNTFGPQRFSKRNADVGRFIVKGEFEKAARLIRELHPKEVKQKLIDSKSWVQAIRSIPRGILMLYVHAYQSFIWNEAAKRTKSEKLAIVGFGSEVDDPALQEVLEGEGVGPRDFIIRSLPNLSAEGGVRDVWAVAEDLVVSELEPDEFFEGKKKVVFDFFLKKGCYATEFIDQLFQRR